MGNDNESGDKHVEDQAKEQTEQKQIQLRIDERGMQSNYANAFRTNGTAEEVVLDFGVNLPSAVPAQPNQAEIIFQVNQRVIMNYYSAKRLAISLGQLVRRHEEQFGELELDVARRRKGA